jgi:hypothetical protein
MRAPHRADRPARGSTSFACVLMQPRRVVAEPSGRCRARTAPRQCGPGRQRHKIDAEAVHARNAPVPAGLISAAGTTLSRPDDDTQIDRSGANMTARSGTRSPSISCDRRAAGGERRAGCPAGRLISRNSGNSSMPPSSDEVLPGRGGPKGGLARRGGGGRASADMASPGHRRRRGTAAAIVPDRAARPTAPTRDGPDTPARVTLDSSNPSRSVPPSPRLG